MSTKAKVQRAGRSVLRLPQVKARTGKSRSSIYDGVNEGTFPAPIPLGERAVGWLEHEIDAWLDGQTAIRDHRRGVAA
jgi:prophage regulatory protein